MKRIVFITVGILLLACINGCKPKADNPLDSYNRGQLLSDIYTHAIVPAHHDFVVQAALLDSIALVFAQSPTLDNLTALQQQWRDAQKTWQICEPIKIGNVRDLGIFNSINRWPLRPATLENYINGTDSLNSASVETWGAVVKGFPAIEYLIFGTDDGTMLQSLTGNARRVQCLTALTANLKSKSAQLFSAWETYKPAFVAEASLTIAGSVNMMVNALIEYEEFIKNDKVGMPLGKKSSGTPRPESVESALSNTSMQHIVQNLKGIDAMLNGTVQSSGGNGLYTYIDAVDPMADGVKLSDKIKGQMQACYTAANAINQPLEDAVVNNTAQVDTLYLELKKLTVLLKVDMTSILGVTVTFTDNDGD